jgi:hypothetical protein
MYRKKVFSCRWIFCLQGYIIYKENCIAVALSLWLGSNSDGAGKRVCLRTATTTQKNVWAATEWYETHQQVRRFSTGVMLCAA